ncbi:MAG: proton-conducting transporter membrane subunit [Candidatus Bathyarchaeota archaeon]|nr:proton-conducting transporter membrane subunit [Candidatus Bathyarchaeota archaeon]
MIESLYQIGLLILILSILFPLTIFLKKSAVPRTLSNISLILSSLLLSVASVLLLLQGGEVTITSYMFAPNLTLSLSVDRLSAFFILVIAIVSFSVAVFSPGYLHHLESERRRSIVTSATSLFVASMLLLVISRDIFSFLLFWEAMSLSSFMLVMTNYEEREAGKAGLFYFAMTQLSTMCLMSGFLALYALTGSYSIPFAGVVDPVALSVVFVVLFVGFGIKAGVVPFHKWLPYAHPASPSNISALMSGVMIKVAIYGLIRFVSGVASPPLWWGSLILVAGTVSAVLGVIYAMKEHDVKRLLAYHSIENIGIILIAYGLSVTFTGYGLADLANLCLVAALFHTLNHALFKSLLFMTAGSVINATGVRNVEELGGLIKRMPYTAVLFLVGAVAISGLPPFNGFVSELMIFQAFLSGWRVGGPLESAVMLTCLAVFALTSALAAACFVKLFGTMFLAMPRSEEAAEAHEVGLGMLVGPAVPAALCILLGVFSYQILAPMGLGAYVPNMAVFGLALLATGAVVFASVRLLASRETRVTETWGCGIPKQDPRMEYTPSGFSEPIMVIFKQIYRTQERLDLTYYDRNRVILRGGLAEIRLFKLFEERLYLPVARAALRVSEALNRAQEDQLSDTYLLYIFAACLVLLIAGGLFL